MTALPGAIGLAPLVVGAASCWAASPRGSNWRVFDAAARGGGADVRTGVEVLSVGDAPVDTVMRSPIAAARGHTLRFRRVGSPPHAGAASEAFDAVVIAAPLEFAALAGLSEVAAGLRRDFARVHATFVRGALNRCACRAVAHAHDMLAECVMGSRGIAHAAYFGCAADEDVPGEVRACAPLGRCVWTAVPRGAARPIACACVPSPLV